MLYFGYASLFNRSARTSTGSTGAGYATQRGSDHVWRQLGQHQTLGCTPTSGPVATTRPVLRTLTQPGGKRSRAVTRSAHRPTRRHLGLSPALVEPTLSRPFALSCHARPCDHASQ